MKDGRIMLLSVRAYMYLLSRVHSSCNERPTNSMCKISKNTVAFFDIAIIAHLFLFVIGRFDGFLCRLPFFGQIAAVLDFWFPIHSFPFLSVFAKVISFVASICLLRYLSPCSASPPSSVIIVQIGIPKLYAKDRKFLEKCKR